MKTQLALPEAFRELGVSAPLLQGVAAAGFTEPTEIQKELIPVALAGRDVLGQARTGSGKTAAFALPILQTVQPERHLQALVLVPTRELAVQVADEFERLAQFTPLRCLPVYGGQKIAQQLHALKRGPQILVGTPGRTLDLYHRQAITFDRLRWAVLDEVDRMLDIGFRDDIRAILSRITHPHQTIFVSATIDSEIRSLARNFMTDPVEIDVSRDRLTVDEVAQYYVSVTPWDKFNALVRLLEQERPRLAIVFCNTKHGARKLAKKLHAADIEAREIHGDLVQRKRERVMSGFRRHRIPILVATDLASRGIDVQAISHIINYDIPKDPEVYVHRIGRTARMGASGRAITFVCPDEGEPLTKIEKLINRQLEPLAVEGFTPTPPPRGEPVGHEQPPPAPDRLHRPVFASAQTTTQAPVRKTLGGKFRPARRRR